MSDKKHGESIDGRAHGFVDSVNKALGSITYFYEQGQWFNCFLYIGFILTLLLAPDWGFLYPLIGALLERSSFVSAEIYEFLFAGLIFLLFFIYLILRLLKANKQSTQNTKLFVSAAIVFMIVMVANLTLNHIKSIPNSSDDRLRSGGDSLFVKDSPESFVYRSNKRAFDKAINPLSSPFEVAVSLPISWPNGIYNAEEVLRGVAMAQWEWNEDPDHKNSQIVVTVADDGYEEASEEEKIAQDVAKKITSNNSILGVIGHFTSAATQAAANIYKDSSVVLISPTSTAVRCIDSEEEKEDCLALNPFVFRAALNEEGAIDKLLGYINQEWSRDPSENIKIAILYEGIDPYSELYKTIFLEKAQESIEDGVEVVNNATGFDKCDASEAVDENELEDFNPEACFNFIEESGANTLLLVPSTKNNVWVEKVLKWNNEKGYRLLGSDSMYQQSFVSINGDIREETLGMLIPLSWHREVGSDEPCPINSNDTPPLECRAAKLFFESDSDFEENSEPLGINWRTAMAYDASQALFHAIEKVANESCGGLKRFFGRRAICIKKSENNLRKKLSDITVLQDSSRTSGENIKFADGDRTGIQGVIVEAQGGSFLPVN